MRTHTIKYPLRYRFLRMVMAVMATILLLMFLSVGGAFAAASGDYGNAGSSTVCDTSYTAKAVKDDNLLPINRWLDGTDSFHSNVEGWDIGEYLNSGTRSAITGPLMAAGSMMWSGTVGVTSMANAFCVGDTIAYQIDRAIGAVGSAVTSGAGVALIAMLVVASLVASFWNAQRTGARPFKTLLVKVSTVGLITFLVAGAANTTEGEFGTGSPGWFVSSVTDTISRVSSAPAAVVVALDDDEESVESAGDMSCQAYTAKLRYMFQHRYSGDSKASAIPLILSSMWESTGLEAWKNAQFGGQSEWADYVYCRVLDEQSNTPVSTSDPEDNSIVYNSSIEGVYVYTSSSMSSNLPVLDINPDAAAFSPADSSKSRAVSYTGWLACKGSAGSWSTTEFFGGWEQKVTDANADNACTGWWTLPDSDAVSDNYTGDTFEAVGSAFDWGGKSSKLSDLPLEEREFMSYFQGYSSATSTGQALAYAFSSLVVFIVFGAVALLVVLAKFGVYFLSFALFALLLASLMPKAQLGDMIAKWFKKLVGVAVMATGASLVFALIAFFTKIVVDMGESSFESGSILAMLWAAAAPVVAVLLMNWIFKSARLPSPLTVRGAMAWGTGAGLVGGAVGGAMGSAMASRSSSIGRSLRRTAENSVGNLADDAVNALRRGRGGPKPVESRRDDGVGGSPMQARDGTHSTTARGDDTSVSGGGVYDVTGGGDRLFNDGRAQESREREALDREVRDDFASGRVAFDPQDVIDGENRAWDDLTENEQSMLVKSQVKSRLAEADSVDALLHDPDSYRARIAARTNDAFIESRDEDGNLTRRKVEQDELGNLTLLEGERLRLEKTRDPRMSDRFAAWAKTDVEAHDGESNSQRNARLRKAAMHAAARTASTGIRGIGSAAGTSLKVGAKGAGAFVATAAGAAVLGPVAPVAAAGIVGYRMAREGAGAMHARQQSRLEKLKRTSALPEFFNSPQREQAAPDSPPAGQQAPEPGPAPTNPPDGDR